MRTRSLSKMSSELIKVTQRHISVLRSSARQFMRPSKQQCFWRSIMEIYILYILSRGLRPLFLFYILCLLVRILCREMLDPNTRSGIGDSVLCTFGWCAQNVVRTHTHTSHLFFSVLHPSSTNSPHTRRKQKGDANVVTFYCTP